ncbi:MAG: rod shape-determining protein MreC [Parcubacteria group bacterium]|nr:rod shape-determining protein MreC [Parcubacteria group bacterium]
MLKKKNLIAPVALIALIVLYHATPLSEPIQWFRVPLIKAGSPVYRAARAIRQWENGFFHARALAQRVTLLEQSVSELTYALAGASGSADPPQEELAAVTIPANVVAQNAAGSERTLLLDRGTEDGIAKGAAVATPQGVFVGKIISVFTHTSLVRPLTSSESAVAAQTSRDSRVQAVVRGQRGLSLAMELIPQDAAIREGDVAVSSLLEENTPVGLLIGTVATIAYDEGDLFKEAALAPFISLGDIGEVMVFSPVSRVGE